MTRAKQKPKRAAKSPAAKSRVATVAAPKRSAPPPPAERTARVERRSSKIAASRRGAAKAVSASQTPIKLVSARSGAPKSASPKRSSAKRAAAEGPARLLSVTRGDERFEFRDRLPLLPLRDVVVFPYMTVPLLVGRAPSVHAIERAASRDKILFVTAQKRSEVTDPSHEELYRIGTVVRLLQLFRLPDGTLRVLVEGLCRARAERFQWSRDAYVVRLEPLPDPVAASAEGEALMRTVAHQFGDYVHLHRRIPDEVLNSASGITDPITLGHTVSAQLLVKVPIKQQLLEAETPVERLRMLGQTLASELEILKLERKIEGQVRSQVHKNQKEFYLNEQLKAIRKELGHQNEFASELDELGTAIKRARMPREVQAKAIKELDRLSKMSFMSPEATVVRNYVDWLVSLPWSKTTRDHADVSAVERILDEDHYGLRKVKDRIVEYLAVLQLTGRLRGPILCFVGPPGVGKTSLGRSIARALGRKFVRMALGGVRDEAEIRGHRRTYIGSMPGRVVQSLKRAGSRNPVFLLDEIDKLGADFRGDPASALLEVLDPEQNHTFNDHYLEVDFDLSQVMFLCTANSISGIPLALADRMEIIRLPGYLEHEKVAIARDFLLPKQREAAGLAERDVKLPVETLQAIANGWTREAGVRSFERELAAICRKVARKRAAGEAKRGITVTPDQLTRYLGPVRYLDSKIEQRSRIGVANGLAWTDTGGDVLTIEVSVVPGKGELLLTGKLGEVMRESGQAAMSYLRSRAKVLGLEKWFYRELDIHVHVPEGAMPKDGPSAGITMATALVSALTGIATRPEVGMTGEITLRGTVLPIGGLAEKSVAARRAGLTTVLIPLANAKDLEEIAPEIRREVEFVTVESMDDVLMRALERSPLVASNETEPAPAVVTPAPPATPAAGDAPPVAH